MKHKKVAVSDSSSLILLARISLLRETAKMFKIIIPQKVFDEAVIRGKELKKEDAFAIEKYIEEKAIEIHKVKETPKVRKLGEQLNIGKGEMEAFHLYFNKNADLILIYYKQAIKLANLLEIEWMGVPNIVLLFYRIGLIDYEKSLEKMSLLEQYGRYKIEYMAEMKKKIDKLKGENHAKK